jgi:hypothetical protein
MSALTVALAAGPSASAQETWKLYDLRDLIAVLPPTTPPEEPCLAAGARSADELMERVCNALGVRHAPFLGGVYGVEAGDAEHTQVRQLLEQIRSLYSERYAVELVWFTAPAGETPSIGDQVAPAELHHRHRLVVARRTPTPLVVVTRHSYVSDLTAVVATSAATHDPRTAITDAGLQLSVLVGAGPEEADSTSIQLVGELRRVTMGRKSGPVGTLETGSMAIELPTVSTRSIRTDLRLTRGKVTVLNVLDGFKEDECIVLAGSVKKL